MRNRSGKLIITSLVALFMLFSMITPTKAATKDEFINDVDNANNNITPYAEAE